MCRDLVIDTDLHLLPREQLAAVLAHLADSAGLELRDLEKARKLDEGDLDPRYPEITQLVRKARQDWQRWGKRLVESVRRLLDDGRLLPMRAETEALLHELLRDHEVAITWRMTGHGIPSRSTYDRLVATGLIESDLQSPSLVEVSWRLGRKLSMLEPHQLRTKTAPPLERTIRSIIARPLSDRDKSAMAYCQKRAAVYMRRPATMAANEIDRVLNQAEFAALRTVEAKAIGGRWSARKFASELADGLQGHPTLVNDLDRVARTELVFAQCHGAYTALKHQASDAGLEDPRVYKLVSPFACRECKRIWGLPGAPIPYLLSEIEEREAGGGNFRLPRAQWGPCIGPIHPNCTEGPLQYYEESLVRDINEIVEQLAQTYDRR